MFIAMVGAVRPDKTKRAAVHRLEVWYSCHRGTVDGASLRAGEAVAALAGAPEGEGIEDVAILHLT